MRQAVVIYDGDCGFCRSICAFCRSLDWLGALRWVPLDDPSVERYGIPRIALARRLYLVQGLRQWSGFAAVTGILMRLPLLAPLGVLALPLSPLGERCYDFVARHRYRLPGSTCRPGF